MEHINHCSIVVSSKAWCKLLSMSSLSSFISSCRVYSSTLGRNTLATLYAVTAQLSSKKSFCQFVLGKLSEGVKILVNGAFLSAIIWRGSGLWAFTKWYYQSASRKLS